MCCEVLGLGAAQEEVPLVLMHSEAPAGLSCYAGHFSSSSASCLCPLERGGLMIFTLAFASALSPCDECGSELFLKVKLSAQEIRS